MRHQCGASLGCQVAHQPSIEPVAIGAAEWPSPLAGRRVEVFGDGLPANPVDLLKICARLLVGGQMQHPLTLMQQHDRIGRAVILI